MPFGPRGPREVTHRWPVLEMTPCANGRLPMTSGEARSRDLAPGPQITPFHKKNIYIFFF